MRPAGLCIAPEGGPSRLAAFLSWFFFDLKRKAISEPRLCPEEGLQRVDEINTIAYLVKAMIVSTTERINLASGDSTIYARELMRHQWDREIGVAGWINGEAGVPTGSRRPEYSMSLTKVSTTESELEFNV